MSKQYSRVIDPTNPKCGPKGGYHGLIFTDFRPEKSRTVNVYDNTKYRKFLQNNATELMKSNLGNVTGKLTCCVNKDPKEKTHATEKYKCGNTFGLFNGKQ